MFTPLCGHDPLRSGCGACKHFLANPQTASAAAVMQVVTSGAATATRPRCLSLGQPNGTTDSCKTCNGTIQLPVHKCAVHNECNPHPNRTADVVASCRDCTDYAPGPSITVNQGAGGLGDAMLGLLAIAGLRRENPAANVLYRVGPKGVPFARLFDGPDEVAEHDLDKEDTVVFPPGDRQMNRGYAGDISGTDPTPRHVRYARNVGVGECALPTLREPDRVRAAGERYAGYVALCPFSAWSDREYSLQGWLTLEGLLRRAGYRTVVLHNDPDRCAQFAGEAITGATPERVAGVLLNAACAIGCDSGLSHLAGVLGTPTIVLMGQTKGDRIFGGYPNARWLDGVLGCSGCHWQTPAWSDRCRPHCPSLQSIAPERILREVDAIVLPGLTGGRSLLSVDRLAGIRNAILATAHLPGDVAELGVYRGGASKIIGHFAPNSTLHLYDTFAGIPTDDEFGEHKAGDFAASAEDVLRFLANARAVAHAGTFPGTAEAEARYRFVHVDGDTYQTTRAAIEHFAPRMVSGGIIVWDDYGWWKTPGVAKALHERFERIDRSAEYQATVRF